MHLIIDTETTGFPSKSLPANHPGQARICQIAALKLDAEFNEIGELYTLIKPDGWQISKGASECHGISMEMCEQEGRAMKEVMDEFLSLTSTFGYIVAHNYKFDYQMLVIEETVNNKIMFPPCDTYQSICTMELCTPICKLPHTRRNAFGQAYKWPKLVEAYKFFFPNEEMAKAHDALSDVRATAKIYRKLIKLGHIKIEATV